jgi:hypothetical protein
LLKSEIWTQYPMGKQRRTLQKCLSKIYSENRNSAKNNFCKLPQTPDFRCLYAYLKIGVFKTIFFAVIICKHLIFIDVIYDHNFMWFM